jgi:tRNA(Arg) A34 adenosine deaminase TadA
MTAIKKCSHNKFSLKAVIYDKKGNVLSIGQNSYIKSHPYMKELASKHGMPYKIFLHAEVAAILKCNDLSKAYRILVTRTGKSGDLLLATPCKICQSAISAAGIKIIEHS